MDTVRLLEVLGRGRGVKRPNEDSNQPDDIKKASTEGHEDASSRPALIFIDVRTDREVSRNPLTSNPFLHIELNELLSTTDLSSLRPSPLSTASPPENHDYTRLTAVVVFCASAERSRAAAQHMGSLGVHAINGGGVADLDRLLKEQNDTFGAEAHPLQNPADKGRLELVTTLDGHSETVWSAVWSPNGKFIASCGGDLTTRIWGRNRSGNWICVSTLEEGHTRTIRHCAWSPCNRYLATVSFDGTTVVWHCVDDDDDDDVDDDIMKWDILAQLEGHDNEVKHVCWNADGSLLCTCGRDKTVWIWIAVDEQKSDFECLSVLQDHTQDVKFVAFHPRLPVLMSASYDDTIRIFGEDGDDYFCQGVLQSHASTVWAFATHQSAEGDELLVSVSDDCCVLLWKQLEPSWSIAQRLPYIHSRPILTVDWDNNGHEAIATGGVDNSICVLRKSLNGDYQLDVRMEQAHDGDVNSVMWSPTEPSLLLSSGDDEFVKLWRYVPE